jgi:hypothetical protein
MAAAMDNERRRHMRRLGSAALILCSIVVASCSNDDERFVDAYTDVLVARAVETDSVRADSSVMKALARYGYTEAEFRREFFDRAREPIQLRELVDSARARAARRLSEPKSDHR